jgi:hypothetical protein
MARKQAILLANKEGLHPAFNPNILMMLEQVVDDAWRELVKSGSPMATRRGERVVRKVMARRVFSQVSHGELDPGRLKQYALLGLLDPLGT